MSTRDDQHLDPELMALLGLGETPGSPDDLASAQRHLSACGWCTSEVDEFAAVTRTARLITPDDALVAPPDSVWAEVSREISPPRIDLARAGRTASGARGRHRFSWVTLAAAACVGLLVGGGAVFAGTSGQRPTPSQPPAVVAAASLTPLAGSAAHGSVEVVSTTSGPRVLVDVSGLAATDGYYEVWLLDRKGDKLVALGALDGTSHGSFAMPPGVAMSDYPVVDVSLEPSDGNPAHSHQSLVRGTLAT